MSLQSPTRKIILASTSPYRKLLLQRLQLEFTVQSPAVDETPLGNEQPAELSIRLAEAKAMAVSDNYPKAVVIGSDQVAVFNGEAVGKPGDHGRAFKQLRQFSGHSVNFLTAVCVCCSESGYFSSTVVSSEAGFRQLSDSEIERYLELDKPFDCAGSFKSEAGGSALLDHLRSDDPTAIIGLPLITVSALLRENGFLVP